MIAQSLGTANTKAILPQIKEDKILTGAATLSSEWLREKYVVPAGAPYPAQFINAAQQLKDSGVTPKAGIIYQDDDYGAEGLKGLEFAAKEFGFQIVARATYKPTDTEFAAQVTAMKNAAADHVFPHASGDDRPHPGDRRDAPVHAAVDRQLARLDRRARRHEGEALAARPVSAADALDRDRRAMRLGRCERRL